jgi:hypothetical protein
MDNAGILQACRRWYNEVSVRVSLSAPLPEKIALIASLKEKLAVADGLMRKGQKKLLISCLHQPSARHLASIRERINVILAQLNKGRLIENFSDAEKADFIAFGNKCGRFSAKAVRYRGADTDRVLQRLKAKARSYEATEADRGFVDVFHMCSLAEIWLDVKANEGLLDQIGSMVDIFKSIAFYGRGVEVYPLPDCAQLNPWVVAVRALPRTVKIINTHDLYCNAHGEITMSGERHNNLLVLGGSRDYLDVETHVQTFTLAGWSFYHRDARLAMAGAVLAHLLDGPAPQALPEWKLDELDLLRTVLSLHTRANSAWWHEYCDALRADPRVCLVTEAKELPPAIRCPGLNKFLLALWWLLDASENDSEKISDSLNLAFLKDARLALVVEFLGRCKASLKDYVEFQQVACAWEGAAWEGVKGLVASQHMGLQSIKKLLKTQAAQYSAPLVQGSVQLKEGDNPLASSLERNQWRISDLGHNHLSIPKIEAIFSNLAGLQGWELPPLTEEDLLRALLTAHCHSSSLARSRSREHLSASLPELSSTMASLLAGEERAQRSETIYTVSLKQAAAHLKAQHSGLPCQLPADFIKRYLLETGRDIAADYLVDPLTGLSGVACLHASCDLFLKLPKGSDKRRRSLLKAHLQACCCVIPGLHASVARFKQKPAAEIVCRIRAGGCLKQAFPSRSFGLEKHGSDAPHRQQAALLRRLDSAVAACNGGDTLHLFHLIGHMQETQNGGWAHYDAFKEAFDRRYCLE